jgi:hypothetical protein
MMPAQPFVRENGGRFTWRGLRPFVLTEWAICTWCPEPEVGAHRAANAIANFARATLES